MNTLAVKFLVLCNALLLALPAGWCCLPAAPEGREVPVPSAPTCCASQEREPAPDDPSPVHSDSSCCCQKDGLRAMTAEQSLSLSTAILAVVPGIVAAQPEATALHTAVLVDASPPLHVLQCVWRC